MEGEEKGWQYTREEGEGREGRKGIGRDGKREEG